MNQNRNVSRALMGCMTKSVMLNHEKHIIQMLAMIDVQMFNNQFILCSNLFAFLFYQFFFIIKIEDFEWLKPEWDSFKIRKFVTFPCMQCQKTTWRDELCARIIQRQLCIEPVSLSGSISLLQERKNAITPPRTENESK